VAKHQSKSPEEAEDRGREDGIKQSELPLITEIFQGPEYRGDANYPRAYDREFDKAKKGS